MDWKTVVGVAAPWLGGALGGPLGGLAVTAIAESLGLSEKTEAAVKAAIARDGGASAEQILSIRQAEFEFSAKMREMGFTNARDMEAFAAGDRSDARKREATVLDKTPRNLAYGVTGGFFIILVTTMFFEIPPESRDIFNIMLGTLGGSFSGVVAYYFGSTAGSQKKTELLAKADAIK